MPPYVFLNSGPFGKPALFSKPVTVIAAHGADDVPEALHALEQAQADGHWLAGYCSYELGLLLDPHLASLLPGNRNAPLLCFGVFAEPSEDEAAALLAEARSDAAHGRVTAFAPEWSENTYMGAFDRVKEYIRAGDIYQANLTFPIRARYEGSGIALYGALQNAQPVPYGAIVALEDGPVVLSCSPELFFEVGADRTIETRPMKGTMPKGRTPEDDRRLLDTLKRDPKNRTENLMIVDLLRNDLSRISEIGSVAAPELFTVESYATVHQMVSRIRARLLPGVGLAGILRGLFPSGSITGVPKIRAMEIIRELECEPRNAYCGMIGWAAPDGRARFNVAIRTLSLYEDRSATLNVGGAITFESHGPAEYEEALWKARFTRLPQTTCR